MELIEKFINARVSVSIDLLSEWVNQQFKVILRAYVRYETRNDERTHLRQCKNMEEGADFREAMMEMSFPFFQLAQGIQNVAHLGF